MPSFNATYYDHHIKQEISEIIKAPTYSDAFSLATAKDAKVMAQNEIYTGQLQFLDLQPVQNTPRQTPAPHQPAAETLELFTDEPGGELPPCPHCGIGHATETHFINADRNALSFGKALMKLECSHCTFETKPVIDDTSVVDVMRDCWRDGVPSKVLSNGKTLTKHNYFQQLYLPTPAIKAISIMH